jgi:hypothetical protein
MKNAFVIALCMPLIHQPAFGQLIGSPVINPANGHRYQLIGPGTWTAAEAQAVTLGGHLATIDGQEENAWIGETFSDPDLLWIGLNEAANEGQFVWSSGEQADYRNWRAGEPNNFNGEDEDYVYMYNYDGFFHQWNDAPDDGDGNAVYGVAEVVPELFWTFSEPQLPQGWVTPQGFGGKWVKNQSSLRAVNDGSALNVTQFGTRELIIDAWTPPFRITNAGSAEFSVDLSALANDPFGESVEFRLYRTTGPGLPTVNDPKAIFFSEKDLTDIPPPPNNVREEFSFFSDIFGGQIPDTHLNNETVYRIRTSVFDNDTEPDSLRSVDMKNFDISYAVLHSWGDYNSDDVVDGADFLLWQRELGLPAPGMPTLRADGDGSYHVDAADLSVWRQNYGKAAGASSIAAAQSLEPLPEPSALFVMLIGGTALGMAKGLRYRQ